MIVALFTAKERHGIGEVTRTHPMHDRKITLRRIDKRDAPLLIVSGGDLGDFRCSVACDGVNINWVADAMGQAPAPFPGA